MRKCVLFLTMFLCLLGVEALAQQTISGTIVDSNNEPLIGATIRVEGNSTLGAIAGVDGYFIIENVPSDAQNLVASSIGYKTQTLAISGSTVSIIMQEEDNFLEDVVVVGYGTQKRTEITGSLAKVGEKDLEDKQFSNVVSAIQGQAPGVNVIANSGQPGSAISIRVRGTGSINGNNEPLYIIDGVYVNSGDFSRNTPSSSPLASINPNDIESITILKDASSTAIYGSKAANGVVFITTKKGKAGKGKIQFNSEFGVSDEAVDFGTPLNSTQYIDLASEGLLNAGFAPDKDAAVTLATNVVGWDGATSTDWQNQVRRDKGTQQSYSLGFSGGNKDVTYRLSGGYFQQTPLISNSDFERISGNLIIGARVNDKVKIDANISASNFTQFTPSNGGAFANPLLNASLILPTAPVRSDDGEFNFDLPFFGDFNAVALAEANFAENKTQRYFGNLTGTYDIIEGLTLTSRLGLDNGNINEFQYWNPEFGDGTGNNGNGFANQSRRLTATWANFLNYNFSVNEAHNFFLTGGYEIQTINSYGLTANGQNYPRAGIPQLANAAEPSAVTTFDNNAHDVGAFTRLSYDFKDKYVLNGSYRRDGSSRFGVDERYGNFWSIGASWNADREAFMDNVEFINSLKLRASYGVLGNQPPGFFGAQGTYGFGPTYNDQPGGAINGIGNPNYAWEENKPLNIGLDFSMFESRLNASFDWYDRDTESLLFNQPLPVEAGGGAVQVNDAAMNNTGFEFVIGGTPLELGDLVWESSLNFSHNENTVTFVEEENDAAGRTEGQPLGAYFLRQYAGVDAATGEPMWYTDASRTTTTFTIGEADRIFVGDTAVPENTLGFRNTISYKGVYLDGLIYYAGNFSVRDTWAFTYLSPGRFPTLNKITQLYDNIWREPGDEALYPKFVWNNDRGFSQASTANLYEGDFIRLREVNLGYNLPKNLIQKFGVENVSIAVKGTNLWTHMLDDDLYFDPEQGFDGSANLNLAPLKSGTFGIDVTF